MTIYRPSVLIDSCPTAKSSIFSRISFSMYPVHLLSAALMSAPASLAISKVLCPETSPNRLNNPQSTGVKTRNELKKNAFPASNLLEAATVGISMSIAPVAGILFRNTFRIFFEPDFKAV